LAGASRLLESPWELNTSATTCSLSRLAIVFQYFAIAPMRGLGLKDGLIAATKADFISLTAFEVGLFGWMAIMAFVLFPAPHHLMPSSAAYWLLMQTGMIIGYCTSWPANVWLVKRGIKVPM
jgi:ABC-type antimicrobial peptide transport system permease subunit